MAHFAEINEEGIVQRVLVVSNERITQDGEEVEELGIAYLQKMFPDTNWVQTSYNGNFRGRYAGRDSRYDAELDGFITPQPSPSWTLNKETFAWEPPIPMPEQEAEVGDEGFIHYVWDEENQSWVEMDMEQLANNNNDI
tara:strand:- start:421 stop:837 length:417 start_codon:yes stop_codon:yes gene_type:complete